MSFFVIILIHCFSRNIIKSSVIQCWCPAQFTDDQVDYIESYCWVRNTYIVNLNESLPTKGYFETDREIQYYPWAQLIFLMQAIAFYFPRVFWQAFGSYSSLNLMKLLRMAEEATFNAGDKGSETIENIAIYLEKYFRLQNCVQSRYRTVGRVKEKLVMAGLHRGNYLVFIFLLTAFLYLASSFWQFLLVDLFLDVDFINMGFDYISRMLHGGTLSDNQRFPTVTFCDFDIRQITNVQKWTVQCSLPVNRFNEIYFLLDWTILFIMTAVNAVYFLYSLVFTILPYRGENCIKKYLEKNSFQEMGEINDPDNTWEKRNDFIHTYLKRDGVFLFWLIGNKVNEVVASEIATTLWRKYLHG